MDWLTCSFMVDGAAMLWRPLLYLLQGWKVSGEQEGLKLCIGIPATGLDGGPGLKRDFCFTG